MMNLRTGLLLAAVLVSHAGGAAGGTTLTFEGLKNFEQVENYYNGGMGSRGSGPGPSYGVTFSRDALAYIPGEFHGKVTPYPGDPSPPTVLLLGDLSRRVPEGYPLSMTMNVSGGFVGALTFYDIAIVRTATVTIWSGLDGTGTELATLNLPLVPVSNEAFAGPETMSFSGTAHSVVFSGGNDQLALDNISFQSVPEPASWLLVALGIGGVFFVRGARRLGAAGAGNDSRRPCLT
jgi:hypothetical protein